MLDLGFAFCHNLVDNPTKQVLLQLVDEIHDLRANLDLVAVHKALRMSIAEAQEGKSTTFLANKPRFDALRKQIEAL